MSVWKKFWYWLIERDDAADEEYLKMIKETK